MTTPQVVKKCLPRGGENQKCQRKFGSLVSLLQLFMMSNLSTLFNTLRGKMRFPQTDQNFNIYFFLCLNLLLHTSVDNISKPLSL